MIQMGKDGHFSYTNPVFLVLVLTFCATFARVQRAVPSQGPEGAQQQEADPSTGRAQPRCWTGVVLATRGGAVVSTCGALGW